MLWRRPLYFVRKAFASVREAPALTLLAVSTVAASLVVVGLYVMALQNLERLTLVWGRNASVAAYLADDHPPAAHENLRQQILALPGVSGAVVVTPEAALERFRARGPEAAALVEGVTPTILPVSIELTLTTGFADLDAVTRLANKVKTLEGIAEVDFGQTELERLGALLDVLRYGGLGFGVLVALVTAFIVSNTIRLTVYARRDEIAVLRLVGATPWFVRMPFVIEGAVWGAGGAAIALAVLALADQTLAARLDLALRDLLGGLHVRLISSGLLMLLPALGIGTGAVGSMLAVRRFLEDEEPL